MKNLSLFIFIFFTSIIVESCRSKSDSNETNAKINSSDSSGVRDKLNNHDTSDVSVGNGWDTKIDTVYKIQINNKDCQLLFTHEFPSPTGDLTTTIRIIENENHDTLFSKTLDFNTVGEIEQPAPNHYWFTLEAYGGGAGYSGTLFNVRTNPKIMLQPIVNIDELSSWKSNLFANELIFFRQCGI